ncbi:MAG: TonB-dependent receptor [Methylomarinum sp.]|nr:TonB-dependent receptor [Methylomarinum sp.]
MAGPFLFTPQLCFLSISLLYASVIMAESINPDSLQLAELILPEIQVTGNQSGLYHYSLMPVTGITREQFANQPDNGRLGDVINRLPGVFMGGAPGENKDIRLRGMDKEFTRFEFDGLQLPGGGEKREFQVNRISPFAIGELKILRNATAEYESDGIAGRITADLRAIPDQFKLDFKGMAGGIDTIDGEQRAVSLAVGDRYNDRFGFNLFLDYNRFPLEKRKIKDKFKADGSLKERETETEDKPGDSYNALLDAVWMYDDGEVHFKPMWFNLDEDKDMTKLKIQPGKDPSLEAEQEDKNARTWGGTLAQIHRFENGGLLESDFSYIKGSEDKDKKKTAFKQKNGIFELDKTEVEDETKEDMFYQVRSKVTVPFTLGVPHTLKTGFHFRFRDRFRNKDKIEIKADGKQTDKTTPKDNYKIEENYWAGFIQDELNITQDLAWGLGLRVEHVRQKAASGDGVSQITQFTDFNPSTHLRYSLSSQWTVHGAVSRSLNRPKFDELAPFENEKNDRFVLGNPDLQPAASINYDVGISYNIDNLMLAVNLFHKDIKDVIEEVDSGEDRDGKDIFRVENVGDGWTRGIELEQRVQLDFLHSSLEGLTLWGNESLLDSELRDKNGIKRKLNEQPDLIANFGIEYQLAATGTRFNVTAKFRDQIEKVKEQGEKELERSQWSLDFTVRQELVKDTELFFNALNLFDTKKQKSKSKSNGEQELETESTGRVFMVGIQTHF